MIWILLVWSAISLLMTVVSILAEDKMAVIPGTRGWKIWKNLVKKKKVSGGTNKY